ncbi:MAG: 1-acyl-sn-glycerol-3-phosphate acyltransferase [Clostridiales bacterium]|nr:1-acyl-sn-glycerol-3-phosphate acyltransferase [Clostridiales bacterium]
MKRTKGDFFYTLLKQPVNLYLKNKFNIHIENNPLKNIDGPYLLLGHHVTAFDPIISNMVSNRLIRYIAADANYDSKLKKFLLDMLESIPFSKNRSDSRSIREILRHIKMGRPVGLYPEGGRNWDGETDIIIPSTAKLIKLLKVPVYAIFYKGGFLSKPRWASHFRKGKMVLDIKEIFSRERIAGKTAGELHDLLVEELSYDEFQWQKENRILFRGKRLAEDIERLLYICADCQAVNSISSKGNEFYCKICHTRHSINEYGMIEDCKRFNETVSWNRWQRSLLPKIIEDGFFFTNSQILLERIETKANNRTQGFVDLIFTQEKVTIKNCDNETEDIRPGSISGLSITFLDVVEFFVNGTKYRFTFDPKKHMSVKLFFDLITMLKRGTNQ